MSERLHEELPEVSADIRPRLRELLCSDRASAGLGATLVRADAGALALRLVVTAAHSNAHGICHGGVIFFLADAATGLLANARAGADERWVTYRSEVSFLAPAQEGDVLDAHCTLDTHDGERRAVFTTVVHRGEHRIAAVRCHMARTRPERSEHAR